MRDCSTKEITPLIERMTFSSVEEIAEQGAMWVVATFLLEEGKTLRGLANKCRTGSVPCRIGAAVAAEQVYRSGQHTDNAAKLLIGLFDDEDANVRDHAAWVFRSEGIPNLPGTPSLAESFVNSGAYRDDPGNILHPLTEYTGDLRPFSTAIIRASEELAGVLVSASQDCRNRIGFAGNDLSILLMRLYECTYGTDDKLADACLD